MSRYCPLCENIVEKFNSFGLIPREDASCPICHSLERHRLLWLYIKNKQNLLSDFTGKMLHVTPERIFSKLFKEKLKENYLSADLYNTNAMVQMDITNINYSDETFDYIYCSHVLEHVLDDRKAMKEFHRVLKKDGWAILLVPIADQEITYEDSSIVEPEEREKAFGQKDHVRVYGRDYFDRLKKSGFSVETISPKDFLSDDEIVQMGITKASGEIFFCTKRS